MVPFNIFCGSCYFCARGLYSNCHNVNPNATAVGGIYGYSHTCGGYDGGQAEFVRVPFADVGPSRDPGLDGRRGRGPAAPTPCPPATSAPSSATSSRATPWWCSAPGRSGLFAAKSAWLMGAGRVIVIDHLEYRLEKARTLRPRRDVQLRRVRRHRRAHEEGHRLSGRRRGHRRGGRRGRRQLPAARHRRQAQAAGRIADRAELGDRLRPQGRHRLGDGRVRPDVQCRQVRRRHEQGPDAAA